MIFGLGELEIEFDKRDKGTWIINSGMYIQLKGGA